MAKAKTGLASKLGAKGAKALKSVRNNETRYSAGGDLPPGINNGIAELTECKFGVYENGPNTGEYYFYAHGAVRSPKKHKLPDGSMVPIEGQLTKIGPIPMCEVTLSNGNVRSVEDQLDRVLNEMRKLGYDTSDLEVDGLEDAAAELKEAGPSFKFRTWASAPTEQYPNPRTNHDWQGAIEDDGEGEEEDDEVEVDDDEDGVEADEVEEDAGEDELDLASLGEAADADDETAQLELTKLCGDADLDPEDFETWTAVAEALSSGEAGEADDEDEDEEEDVEYEEVEEEEGEEPELDGEAADAGDDEAIAALTEAAEAAGLDPDEYETWTALAEALSGEGEDEEEAEDEEEEAEPEVGEQWYYKAPGTRKAVLCEVKRVVKGKKTVNLKGVENNRVYNSVPWAKLQAEE